MPNAFDQAASSGALSKTKWGTLTLIVLFHLAMIVALARAFAPDFTNSVVDQATSILTVNIAAPEEKPEPPPVPDEGAAAAEGKQAKPRDAVVPPRIIPAKPTQAPPVASTGQENQSGASATGAGTGGGGEGIGTGSGQAGTGTGNGNRKLEKTAGDINSSKDYPKKTRALRIDQSVTILLSVGTDGKVTDCRVTEPSPDAEADRITCKLAIKRFRFNPATNASGEPTTGTYRWRQRWYY